MKKSKGNRQLVEDITAVILAGGKSSRFGSNKALAEFKGIRLIERVTDVLSKIFTKLIIITNSPVEYSYLNIPLYQDLIEGLGPIGGIYTGLDAIDNDWAFFCACDMPYINEDLVRHIIEVKNGYDAVVPKVDWKMEPLHALYSRKCLPFIKKLILEEEYQTVKSFKNINVKFVEEDEIKQFDPFFRAFLNVNKQDELKKITNME